MNDKKELVILGDSFCHGIGTVSPHKNIQSVSGENTIIINEMISLKSGIYFAQLTDENGFVETIKLLKN